MLRSLLVLTAIAAPLAACGGSSSSYYDSGYRKGFSEGYRSGYSDRPYYDRSTSWSGDYGSSRRRGLQPPSDY